MGTSEKVDGPKLAADILARLPKASQVRITSAISEQDPVVAAKVSIELARSNSEAKRVAPAPAPEQRLQKPLFAPSGPAIPPKALPEPKQDLPATDSAESAADKLLKKQESEREQSRSRTPSKKGYVA